MTYQQSHQHNRPVRACYGPSNPNEVAQYQTAAYETPAPMPVMQLNTPLEMPPMHGDYGMVPSQSNVIGDSNWDTMTTQYQGTSSNPYYDGNYCMDPGMMTPASMTDIQGLQTFMPSMGGGIGNSHNNGNGGEPEGLVDPATGLPLFTTGKLIRSQLLGGIGAGSFLRQVQDPLSGSAKIGRSMYPCKGVQQRREDWEIRRKQFNAARLETNDGDPVLFNNSEWAYY